MRALPDEVVAEFTRASLPPTIRVWEIKLCPKTFRYIFVAYKLPVVLTGTDRSCTIAAHELTI